jgi:asparagine synthase (glutamine-hydrolysing)
VLGHRRLAIIDLAGGRQPMTAEQDGRCLAALTYSGEVYNFRELRAELVARGRAFRTSSDTEVVLRGYLEWGDAVAERLNGMYAFAVWDVRRQALVLVRDRLGIKPLYYRRTGGGVLFGSEPKAILAHPDARPAVHLDGLRELLTLIATPRHAVWHGMRTVEPGTVVTVTAGDQGGAGASWPTGPGRSTSPTGRWPAPAAGAGTGWPAPPLPSLPGEGADGHRVRVAGHLHT